MDCKNGPVPGALWIFSTDSKSPKDEKQQTLNFFFNSLHRGIVNDLSGNQPLVGLTMDHCIGLYVNDLQFIREPIIN